MCVRTSVPIHIIEILQRFNVLLNVQHIHNSTLKSSLMMIAIAVLIVLQIILEIV